MARIYTKTGDKGETSLVGGSRISKSEFLIDLYGEVDELNSFIGYLAVKLSEKKVKDLMEEIQSSLFDLGSQLACEFEKRSEFQLPLVPKSLIQELEKEMDLMQESLPKLKNFILPGGCEAASRSHVCRVIARRVERKLVGLEEDLRPENSIELLNRLSDYFFVLARKLNKDSSLSETEWKPSKRK